MDNSNIALILSILSLFVSIIAFYFPYRKAVISSIQLDLTEKAKECNKYINPISLSHPTNTQEVSAVVTEVLNARDILGINYKDHRVLLLGYDQKLFIRYFYKKLHSSIHELIKNELPYTVDDLSLRPKISQQQLNCRLFLDRRLD